MGVKCIVKNVIVEHGEHQVWVFPVNVAPPPIIEAGDCKAE